MHKGVRGLPYSMRPKRAGRGLHFCDLRACIGAYLQWLLSEKACQMQEVLSFDPRKRVYMGMPVCLYVCMCVCMLEVRLCEKVYDSSLRFVCASVWQWNRTGSSVWASDKAPGIDVLRLCGCPWGLNLISKENCNRTHRVCYKQRERDT
jgi:hypothetical protein